MGCGFSILEISDGTETINLRDENSGAFTTEWSPAVSGPKDGGVWHDSPLADGRQLAMRKLTNVVETMTLQVKGFTQDDVARSTQDIRRLLEKAVAYFTSDWQNEPVWIRAKAANEENERYAVIYDYRTPNDGFPYCDAFCADDPGFVDWSLVLERGHWQADEPGSATCVEVSAQQDGLNLVLNPGFETAGGGGADVFANWTEFTAGGGVVADETTYYHSGSHAAKLTIGAVQYGAYVMQTIAVLAGSTYRLKMWARGDGTCQGVYRVADNGAAVPDLIPHTYTGVTEAEYVEVIEDFLVPAGVVAIDLYLYGPDVACTTGSAYFDDISIGLLYGSEASCSDQVYFTNKHVKAQLTDIYHWTAGPVWSGNLIGAAKPVAFLPAVPAVGDIVYFGCNTALADSGPFSSLVFDIGTAQVDLTTVTWEYYNGAWVALTVQDNTNNGGAGGGDPFDTTGVNSVHWAVPSDWITLAVNGITGYWVRAIVGAIGGAPAPPTQQNRDIYAIVIPYVETDEAQVKGDIPAIARSVVYNRSSSPTTLLYSERVIMGLRSLSRGDSFSAYINLSDEQNHPDITIAVSAPDTAFANNVQSPTGRCAYYNPGATRTLAQEGYAYIDHPLISEYNGKYHAFLRCTQSGGNAGDIFGQLIISCYGIGSNARFETEIDYTNAVGTFDAFDFGVIQLPNFVVAGSVPAQAQIFILLGNGNAAASLYMHDLILIPVDEMAIEVRDNLTSSSAYSAVLSQDYPGTHADIDSVSNPKIELMTTLVSNDTGNHYELLESVNSSPLMLQANADQRLWVFAQRPATILTPCLPRKADPEISHSIQIYNSWRYLSLRGAR